MEDKNTVEQLIFTLGIDNREFARLTKVNILTVQGIVKGEKKLSLNVLNRILRAFPYVNENYLMKREGEMFMNKVIPGDENFNREMLDTMKTLTTALLNNSNANDKRAEAELNNSIANLERAKAERERASSDKEFAQGFNRLTIQFEGVVSIVKEIVKTSKDQ